MLNSSLMALRKVQYDKKLCPLLEQYSKILIFGADNVDSKQLQEIRSALRDHSVVMMGKNTMMRRSLQIYGERTGNKAFLSFIPLIVGKVGLIFTKGDLQEVGVELGKYKVGEPSRVGLVSQVGFVVPPIDIVSQPRSTGMDPSHTSIFEELFGCLASGKYSFKSASHPNRPEPLKELKFCRPGLLKKTVVPEKTLKPQQADTTLRKKNNEK